MEKKSSVDKLIDALREETEAKCAALKQRDDERTLNQEAQRKIRELTGLEYELRNQIAALKLEHEDQLRACVRVSWLRGVGLHKPSFVAVPNDDHTKCVSSPTLAGVMRKLVNKHPEVAEEIKRWTR